MKRILLTFAGLLIALTSFAQSDSTKSENGFLGRIFLPSLEVGFQTHAAAALEGSFTAKTSLEYRFRNNNDFFLRLAYDTYSSRYQLDNLNSTTNTLQGTVQFSDFLFGPGYRFGDETFRLVVGVMGGIKTYEFPTASLEGSTITVIQEGKSLFTSSVLVVLEYYFDSKSALTLTLDQNQVWRRIDFWEERGGAYGISLGFITSLL